MANRIVIGGLQLKLRPLTVSLTRELLALDGSMVDGSDVEKMDTLTTLIFAALVRANAELTRKQLEDELELMDFGRVLRELGNATGLEDVKPGEASSP